MRLAGETDLGPIRCPRRNGASEGSGGGLHPDERRPRAAVGWMPLWWAGDGARGHEDERPRRGHPASGQRVRDDHGGVLPGRGIVSPFRATCSRPAPRCGQCDGGGRRDDCPRDHHRARPVCDVELVDLLEGCKDSSRAATWPVSSFVALPASSFASTVNAGASGGFLDLELAELDRKIGAGAEFFITAPCSALDT